MRKRYLLLLIVLLSLLSGCDKSSNGKVETDTLCYLFEGGMNLESEGGKCSSVIKSYSDCQELIYQVMQDSYNPVMLAAKLSAYDKEFFRDQMLVFINFPSGSSGYRMELENVEYVGPVVKLELRKWSDIGEDCETKYGVIVELPYQKNVNTVEYTMINEKPASTRGEKNNTVMVMGVGEVLGLDYAQITKKLNEAGKNGVRLKLELNVSTYWEAYTPSELSKKEALSLANQYSNKVAAHYSTANEELLKKWDMTGFTAALQIDQYGCWAYAEFPEGITEADVEWIHELVLHSSKKAVWNALLIPVNN